VELDYSLYPDREIPTDLTDAERAEYVERLCRQFDFGTPIASRFVVALRDWKEPVSNPRLTGLPRDPSLLPLGTIHSAVQKHRLEPEMGTPGPPRRTASGSDDVTQKSLI
jgi:hypothetical protein